MADCKCSDDLPEGQHWSACRIASLEAERDLLKQEVFAVREQHGNALIERDQLRAELAVERKRQSAMRTLIASQEGTLSHYRSKQAEADEAVRTLDSERQANATLTAELSECKADAERYRWLREKIENDDFLIARVSDWGFTSWCGDDPDRYIDAALAAREE